MYIYSLWKMWKRMPYCLNYIACTKTCTLGGASLKEREICWEIFFLEQLREYFQWFPESNMQRICCKLVCSEFNKTSETSCYHTKSCANEWICHNARSIMSWEVVPPSHRKLQLHLLSPERIREWIIENLPKVQYLRWGVIQCEFLLG